MTAGPAGGMLLISSLYTDPRTVFNVSLGALAVTVVLTMPGGLWGTVAAPRGWSLLPAGYSAHRGARPERS